MRRDARVQAPNTSCMGNAGNRSAEADTAVSIAVPQQQESAPNHSTISMRCARLPNMHSSCCGNSSLPAPTTHKAFVAAAIHKGNTHLQPERNRSQLHGSIRKQVKPTQCISTSSSRSPESSSHELQCPEHPYTCTVLQVCLLHGMQCTLAYCACLHWLCRQGSRIYKIYNYIIAVHNITLVPNATETDC